jgi:type II secretory pathway pseudopilin PulG
MERDQAGFSYIDVLIGVAILLIGILALVSAMTSSIVMTTQDEQQLAAKQYAASTLESIFSVRDIRTLQFDAIGNIGDPQIPGGIFLNGPQPIWPTAGADGIVGTADDQDGPDGIPNSGDEGTPAEGFQREIKITNIPDPDRPTAPITLRQVEVTIFYQDGNIPRKETITTYIADYTVSESLGSP